MPRRATPLVAAALLLGAAPAWAQVEKHTPAAEAARLNDLAERAVALNMADDHLAAEPALREVIEGWRALGWSDTEAARGAALLWAWSLIELARFDAAEAELVAIATGPNVPDAQLINAWGLLAKMYSRSGRFLDAEQAAIQALARARTAYGDLHPETATAWHNMGTARGEVGRNAEAVEALRQAVALREQLFGPAAEPTLSSIYNLAAHLHARGDPAAAEPLLRRVLDASAPGSESHTYALHHLGFTLTTLNRPLEAEPYLRQAVALRADLPDPHLYAVSLSALGDALDRQGRFREAEALYRSAIAVLEGAWRPGYDMTLSATLLSLAENQQAQGHPRDAEAAYRRSVQIAQANVSPGHPRLTLRGLGFAVFLNDERRPTEALALLRPMTAAVLGRAPRQSGQYSERAVGPFRSLFRETVEAAWFTAQPLGGQAR